MIGFKKFFNLVIRIIWRNKNQAGHRLTSIESVNNKKVSNAAKSGATTCPVPPLKRPPPPLEGYLVSDQGNRIKITSASAQEQLREHLRFIATRPVSIDFYAEKSGNQLETFENLKQASISGLFVLNAVSEVKDNESGIIGVEVRAVSKPPVHAPAQFDASFLSTPTKPQSEVETAEALARESSVANRSPASKSEELASSSPTSEPIASLEISPILELETEQSLIDEAIEEDAEKFAVSPGIMVTDDGKSRSSFSSLPMRTSGTESEEWVHEVLQGAMGETIPTMEGRASSPDEALTDGERGVSLSISLSGLRGITEQEQEIAPQHGETLTQQLHDGLSTYREAGKISIGVEESEVENVIEETTVSPSQSVVSEFKMPIEGKCLQRTVEPNRSSGDSGRSADGDGLVDLEPAPSQPTADALTDLKTIVDQALLSLNKREHEILEMRYGLSVNEPMSLAEIASKFDITPGRVSQILSTAREETKQNGAFFRVRQVVEESKNLIWASLSKSKAYVPKQLSEKKLRELLPSELNFAIASFHGSIVGWLKANACESPNIWYRSNYSASVLQEIVSKLEAEIKDFPLPRPLQSLSDQMECDKDLLELAIQFDGSRIIYEDYVCDVINLYTMRSIHLHRMFSNKYPNTIVTITELVAEYNRLNTNNCLRTDLEMTLSGTPHLFVRVGDAGWCAIGGDNTSIGRGDDGCCASRGNGRYAKGRTESSPLGEKSIVSIIRDYLKRNGPSRFSDLTACMRGLAEQGWPMDGAAPILTHTDSEFLLVASALYGLWEETGCRLSTRTVIKQLLTPKACKRYVLSRYAGEKADAYPIWLYAMEREWCIWAEREPDRELFESLLYIAEPALWPASAQDRVDWVRKKEDAGCYRFESSPGEAGINRIPVLSFKLI